LTVRESSVQLETIFQVAFQMKFPIPVCHGFRDDFLALPEHHVEDADSVVRIRRIKYLPDHCNLVRILLRLNAKVYTIVVKAVE